MNYQIVQLCPRSDMGMGAWGFSIHLFPEFKVAVFASGITKETAYIAVENMGRFWLDGCGFGKINIYKGEKTPLYRPNQHLRIQWGEWGLEHITVPGNACSLDIGHGIGGPSGGQSLLAHNIDSMSQAMLFLVVFTWFAEAIYIGDCLKEVRG